MLYHPPTPNHGTSTTTAQPQVNANRLHRRRSKTRAADGKNKSALSASKQQKEATNINIAEITALLTCASAASFPRRRCDDVVIVVYRQSRLITLLDAAAPSWRRDTTHTNSHDHSVAFHPRILRRTQTVGYSCRGSVDWTSARMSGAD